MLIFNKLLPMFVLPMGWVMLLLLYGVWRAKRWPAVVALTLLYVCGMPVTGSLLTRALESRYQPVALSQVGTADAIVALSGIFGPVSAPGYLPNVGEAGERLEAGIVLWQQKTANWLVFTGGRVPWNQHAEVEGERSKRVAIARGIPATRIVVTGEVGNTLEESLAVANLMRQREWKRIILVTTAWHMPRAARLFRKAGVDIVPFPVDYQSEPNAPWSWLDLLPRAEGLGRTERMLREWYGIGFYALSGR
jgi:uncharacterized SAM-binding protein YcdF (DUF218 family)